MKFAFSAVVAAVLTFGLAAASFAAELTGVTAEGTVGTELTITGTDLGTAAPKVALRLTSDATAKPIPLKVPKQAFTGTTFKAQITKIQPGQYDLLVTPKGGTELQLEGVFTARAPNVTGLSTLKAALGDTIDIDGSFFGNKKGKVTVNGVTAKVKAWADGKITIVISKKSGTGVGLKIDVIGKGGTADDAATIELVAPLSGKDFFTADFAGGATLRGSPSFGTSLLDSSPVRFDVVGGQKFGSGLSTNVHTLTITVVGNLTEGTFNAGQIIAIYTESGLNLQNYTSVGAAGWTVTINQRAGNRVSGTFSGGLVRQVGGGPASYTVTGSFTQTIK